MDVVPDNNNTNEDITAVDTTTSLLQQALDLERTKNEQLMNAAKALQEEFSSAGTYGEQVEIAKKSVANVLPSAVETIQDLIANADSEGVRASLSRWVCDVVLSGKLDKSHDGEIADLFKQLAGNDAKVATPDTTNGG